MGILFKVGILLFQIFFFVPDAMCDFSFDSKCNNEFKELLKRKAIRATSSATCFPSTDTLSQKAYIAYLRRENKHSALCKQEEGELDKQFQKEMDNQATRIRKMLIEMPTQRIQALQIMLDKLSGKTADNEESVIHSQKDSSDYNKSKGTLSNLEKLEKLSIDAQPPIARRRDKKEELEKDLVKRVSNGGVTTENDLKPIRTLDSEIVSVAFIELEAKEQLGLLKRVEDHLGKQFSKEENEKELSSIGKLLGGKSENKNLKYRERSVLEQLNSVHDNFESWKRELEKIADVKLSASDDKFREKIISHAEDHLENYRKLLASYENQLQSLREIASLIPTKESLYTNYFSASLLKKSEGFLGRISSAFMDAPKDKCDVDSYLNVLNKVNQIRIKPKVFGEHSDKEVLDFIGRSQKQEESQKQKELKNSALYEKIRPSLEAYTFCIAQKVEEETDLKKLKGMKITEEERNELENLNPILTQRNNSCQSDSEEKSISNKTSSDSLNSQQSTQKSGSAAP